MDIEQTFTAKQTQTLKNLITEILRNNTAYDCMSINSSVCSISKNASLFDAINIIINENIEELLVWDESLNRWIWMLTIVDAIRLIMHSLKTIIKEGKVNFRLFQEYRQKGMANFQTKGVQQFTKQQIFLMIETFQKKKISQIILEINQPVHRLQHHQSQEHYNKFTERQLGPHEPLYSSKKPPLPPSHARPYIRLKSVVKESKLSFVIMAMIVEKIHRILIEDIESKMIISILNFKDILLYLLRIANQSHTESYNSVTISSLLEATNLKTDIEIHQSKPLWQAFEAMTDLHRSLWINVVDSQRGFKGLLYRQDFRDIFKGWHIDYLWMSAGDFIKLKQKQNTSRIPDYRFFYPSDITKEIIWKIVMTKGNTIVWVDQNDGNKVKATIGLMQLFSLFVH